MPDPLDPTALCSQLLDTDDLALDPVLITEISRHPIVSKIVLNGTIAILRIYTRSPMLLSNITPVLHDFNFTMIDEIAYSLTLPDESGSCHVCRFRLQVDDPHTFGLAIQHVESVLTQSLGGELFDSCRIYALIASQNLTLRHVLLLRAMIEYIDQAVLSINFDTILHTMIHNGAISKLFLRYFITKFNPKTKEREKRLDEIEHRLSESIKQVPDLTEDTVLKLMVELLKAMCRTNFYLDRESIAFKVDLKHFGAHLMGLQPQWESFVYHPLCSGTHLRMSRVSRGGIRWSERYHDYRTEILSLMTTQEGKNAIIVPDGAKGGFIIKKEREAMTPESFEGFYTQFIENLLDLVDNRMGESIVHDPRIIAYDGEDPYFVVAADKGTAEMSDTANAIAIIRGFWLTDAFASGGSQGYNHKALGITARGAFKSTERFFIERGVDLYSQPISLVGIGSMNGDVFGNGMLLSRHFRLLGAISHREIFVDPDPDPEVSYRERKRLFEATNGGWSRYDRSRISEGGGVFLRSQKEINLTPQIQDLLGTQAECISGEALARALLRLPVDLLFNGGVGTYVKHSEQSDLTLGDKQNEGVRVNASDLRCYAVCEGGNLGFTQRARIEYALGGGRINTDAIDNAAGVHTSDQEVNIKILLGILKSKQLIDESQRIEMLHRFTQSVVSKVLWSNYNQALTLSRDETLSRDYRQDFMDAIDTIAEHVKPFSRRQFQIPKRNNISEIIDSTGCLVRPVLASLLLYAKIFMKKILIDSDFIEEPFVRQFLFKYFPKTLVGAYENELIEHPLRREIIATYIADMVINHQGVSFVSGYARLGQEKFILKIKSYLICNELFSANDIRHHIYRQDHAMPILQQYKLLGDIEHVMNFATRWMVQHLDPCMVDATRLLEHKEALFYVLDKLQGDDPNETLDEGEVLRRYFKRLDYLRFAVAVIVTNEQSKESLEDVATLFYLLIERFAILQLINRLNQLQLHEESQRKHRSQLLQFVEYITIHLTKSILSFRRAEESVSDAFESFVHNDTKRYEEIFEAIQHLKEHEKSSLDEIAVIINHMMIQVI
jgi:glutamate dehydrogenase